MKITKRGTPAADKIWDGECRSCGSEAEAKQSELKNITHNPREGSHSWEVCPVCGNAMLFYPR